MMRRVATEAEVLRAIERKRLRALVSVDIDAANELHADDFQLITPAGKSLSKAEHLGAVGSGEIDYLVWEPEEILVHVAGDLSALRYRSEIEGIFSGVRIPPGLYWHTDVYRRGDGLWRVVWSQATAI